MKHYIRTTKKTSKSKLALILGSGFSKDAGLPTTAEIPGQFLITPSESVLTKEIEDEINRILGTFWKKAFGYTGGKNTPSLEDHFTLLDLAANSGHHLGKYYNPKRLRAIRRISIHRVFQILAIGNKKRENLHKLLTKLNTNFDVSIVTLNWDLVVERHLNRVNIPFYYPIESYKFLTGAKWGHEGIPIMKMHGSANWIYCDSCRRIYTGKTAIATLKKKTFLEKDDFKLFGVEEATESVLKTMRKERECPHCGNTMAGRVATFSYRKAFSIAQFQAIWERAHAHLRESNVWLMIGYSLPEADFEFLHLIKSAQMARVKTEELAIEAVVGGRDSTVQRYQAFFGLERERIKDGGLKKWIEEDLDRFVKEYVF